VILYGVKGLLLHYHDTWLKSMVEILKRKNIRRMLQFAEQFKDEQIVVIRSRQLSWSHILVLLPLKNVEAKVFYAKSVAD